MGVELGGATSRYRSAFFFPASGRLGPTRSGVSSQLTAYASVISVLNSLMDPVEQPGRTIDHAVHEPNRRGGAGQRLQQRDDPMRGDELHHHQIHRERRQVGAVPDRPGPGPVGAAGGVQPPAAALDLVLVVLGDGDGDLRDLVLLVAVHDTEVPGAGQIITAVAAALGEPVAALIGVIGPRQMRPRRPGLLAPRPLRPTPAALTLLRRRGLARVIIARGRVRGVPRVARQQMLQPGQPAPSASLASISSAICTGLRGDLPVLRGEPSAWRRTTTISSSRDISSGSDTRRSNRTPVDHPVTDTTTSPNAPSPAAQPQVSRPAECLRKRSPSAALSPPGAAAPVGTAMPIRNSYFDLKNPVSTGLDVGDAGSDWCC